MAAKSKASQAEKAASTSKKNKSAGKSAAKKSSPQKDTGAVVQKHGGIPTHLIVALVCLALFIVFLVTTIRPEGAIVKWILSIVQGFIGKVGFYFSIPVLLYLFVILAFRTKTSVKMRSTCLILFVLICGTISHLGYPERTYSGLFNAIGTLYKDGARGDSAGLICGPIALLFRWACGDVISYIILSVAAVLTLMGALQITIPSLVRAIHNRPREDWDDEEEEEARYVEPATIVVNHIATKRIEQKRRRRQQLEDSQNQDYAFIDETATARHTAAKPGSARNPKEKTVSPKATDMMNQIGVEISAPVAAAAEPVKGEEPVAPKSHEAAPKKADAAAPDEVIPCTMPVFRPEAPIPAAPKTEPKSASAAKGDKVSSKDAQNSAEQVAQEIAQAQTAPKVAYCFPPINLLNMPPRNTARGTEEMRENSRRLNETLASFKIDAHIINVTRGPSVTRYEVELDKGVRLNKLTTCADDIALSLGASGVRIAAVPGKISVVGIEVPNRAVTMVSLREVIDSPEFNASKSKSSFAVGKDIGGSCIIGNIAKMPHMLIAGTTGSGKSVCMNSIIISLLYKAGPEDVKLIMVDPKMVELANYNGIPHLMRRYQTMSDAGVRDLESFNSIIMAEGGEKIPQLVVIIDELADLMLVAAKEVEDSICRIAQMGRAAGIHLVIATQRPSADVITGLMKANIPSRIAFSVASAMESRIILDTQGAEKLVGKGDMLFAPIGCGKPLRVQGCFVTDAEVEAVTSYVKENYVADYDQQVLEEIERKAQQTGKKAAVSEPDPNADELEGDEMLPAAVDVILETGQASVSMLQRRLKLGYARAARIVDEMEEKGIVGPFQGSKPRAILITKEQWQAQKGGSDQMGFDDYDPDAYDVPDELL